MPPLRESRGTVLRQGGRGSELGVGGEGPLDLSRGASTLEGGAGSAT